MKMIQNIKDGYAKMSSTQLEKEMKKSKWAVVAVLGIVFLGIVMEMMFSPNAMWTSYLDNIVWLFLVAFFVFNYRVIRDELASRGEVESRGVQG